MSLAQFLSQLGGNMGGMGNQMIPGMPMQQPSQMPQANPMQQLTGMVQTPPDFMEQVARSQQMPQQDPSPQTNKFTGLRDTLGQIGDYLLQANDMAPIYGPRKARNEQQQASEAVAQYLGNFDPQLGEIARRDPKTGMQLLTALREDTRFNRTAGQDDRRIDVAEGNLDLGREELGVRREQNQTQAALTERAQNVQVQIQGLRMRDAQADRAQQAALKAGDWALARELQGRRENIALKLKTMEGGGDGGYETISETVETPAKTTGGFLGVGGTKEPAKKTVTTRKVPIAQTGGKTVTKAQVTELATQRGMSYAQAEQVARSNGFKVQ